MALWQFLSPTDCKSDQEADRGLWGFFKERPDTGQGACSSAQLQVSALVKLVGGDCSSPVSSLPLMTPPSASYPWASKQHGKCARNSIMLEASDGRNWAFFEVG